MNTDEALKCLRIAQKYRDSNDYPNARKFAQKSINLHPTPEAQRLLQIIEEAATSDSTSASTSSTTSASSSSTKATGTETHASSSTTKSRTTGSDSGPSTSKVTYTEAQIKLVKRVRNCKVTEFYKILELEKTCEENDIKKAYRKVLSDPQKRSIYDQSGGDPESRFGGGGGGGDGGEHMAQHFRFGGGPGFEGEISPEELFNMFFGGGQMGMGGGGFGFGGPVFTTSFGPGGFRRTYVQTGGVPRQRAAGGGGGGAGGSGQQSRWSLILQLAPLLFFFFFSLASNFSSLFSTPAPAHPSYAFFPQEPYTTPRVTSTLSIPYYVSQSEFVKHPIWVSIPESLRDKPQPGSVSRPLMQFERIIEQTWKNQMVRLCEAEIGQRERKIEAKSGFLGFGADWDAVKRIRDEKLDSCEMLKSKGIVDRSTTPLLNSPPLHAPDYNPNMDSPDASSSGQWRFAQCFGDKGEVEDITEADIISTVEFDHTGDYLATGDKGGRVVLFERNDSKRSCEYKFYTEFQSHEPEFDYLKSLEIEEKINKIKWCRRQNAAHFLLSTNDKTIKLWKVFEKTIRVVSENHLNTSRSYSSNGYLRLPTVVRQDDIVAAVPRKVYSNAHAYHINSISINSDGETYISADDLRVNLWNLNISDQSFNIVDIKPVNMEELTEVITAAEFHPMHCNLFMFSSSKGTIKLADMRDSALCDQHAKQYEEQEDPTNRSFFSEIISSISDVKFSHDGRYILSRDYLSLKIWDVNMESRPLKTINIHDHLRGKLCDLYENDCIFDKFECTFSGDGTHVLTGSYHNYFRIYDVETTLDVVLQADKSAFKAKKIGVNGPMAKGNGFKSGPLGKDNMSLDTIDFNKKILHGSWHPRENTIAIAATNNLFLYSAA
ncbi:hypothetical protein Clacol_005538 [Clathrus columnatus]|uniref:Protein phosphatase PP2A regulatory subunit B n=1 Tax=Clathrus columnatus TaxID=1419009 RepID=A0AAV5AEA4_9AGAM|nr:hypothetical protein Clacol_005538 [Clathrus columnatus]